MLDGGAVAVRYMRELALYFLSRPSESVSLFDPSWATEMTSFSGLPWVCSAG